MARYDMTGIGVNLKEVPDDNGGVKLKVLGLLLDGPAHTAGVRQVAHALCLFLSAIFFLNSLFLIVGSLELASVYADLFLFFFRETRFCLLMERMLKENRHLKFHHCCKARMKLM